MLIQSISYNIIALGRQALASSGPVIKSLAMAMVAHASEIPILTSLDINNK